MVKGKDFEVSKEVYERAKESNPKPCDGWYYMAQSDRMELFDESIRCGYGLYNCRVKEVDGKYICSWWRGDTCD